MLEVGGKRASGFHPNATFFPYAGHFAMSKHFLPLKTKKLASAVALANLTDFLSVDLVS
jgi:hypothetical protein